MPDTHLTDASPEPTSRTGSLWWVWQIVTWILLFVTLVALFAVVVVPRVSGAVPYTVLTGSMVPTYAPGTLIVVKKVPASELATGTPITYQIESGKGSVVTHRIISVTRNARGELRFITQGDANDSADANPVQPEQIRGKVWYSIPYLGHINSLISGRQHIQILVVVISGLFIYAAWMIISGLREDRRERPTT